MNKTLTKLLAYVGVLALLGGATIGGMQLWAPDNVKPSNWGKPAQAEDKGDEDENKAEGISVTMIAENGVRAVSLDENAGLKESVTVTATVHDITARYRDVEFSLDWEGSRGEAVSDYVTMDVDGNTATLTCIQAFGTPIILTATVTGTDVFATYRLDYLKPYLYADWHKPFSIRGRLDYYADGINVGYNGEALTYATTAGTNFPDSFFGTGTVKGKIELESIDLVLNYMSPTEHEGNISSTNSFSSLTQYFSGNPFLSGSVSVLDCVTITDFREIKANEEFSFNVNVLDFFAFTDWDYETDFDAVQKYCAGALLEACGSSNSRSMRMECTYSYVYGGAVWSYTVSSSINVNFEALTTDPTGVGFDKGDGHIFGA